LIEYSVGGVHRLIYVISLRHRKPDLCLIEYSVGGVQRLIEVISLGYRKPN
jgi:hypothetical protein